MKLSHLRILVLRIVLGLTLLTTAMAINSFANFGAFMLFVAAYVVLGYDVLRNALYKLFSGKFLGEDFLMSIATIGAFALGEYFEAVAVMLFFQIGEAVQHRAEANSRRSIREVMDIRPQTATVLKEGMRVTLDPAEVTVGDMIIIAPGERVPLDSLVVEGESHIDTSALTGEPLPRSVKQGSEIISGTVNIEGLLMARVTSILAESTVVKVLELVEGAAKNKAPQERFITRFSKVYTPIVVSLALAIAVIPPLLNSDASFNEWFYRALTFLVVSCPCALVISVPLAFFGGIGASARQGVLVKGGNYLEQLSNVSTIIFDKTGTLTEGRFSIKDFNVFDEAYHYDDILRLVAHLESFSSHPIAQSLVSAYEGPINKDLVTNLKEHSGSGISALIEGKEIAVGSYAFIKRVIEAKNGSSAKRLMLSNESVAFSTQVYISIEGKLHASISLSDKLRSEAKHALASLKALGVERTVILSGDQQLVVDRVAGELGIREAWGDLLPHDKVELAKKIIAEEHALNRRVAVVGDGINDAPMLALSDIGISMGVFGSEAAIEASDLVIMSDSLERLPHAIEIGRKTKRIATQNIVLSLAIKIGVIGLSTFGYASLLLAIFADVGVALLAIINSTRILIDPSALGASKSLKTLLSGGAEPEQSAGGCSSCSSDCCD